MRIKPTIGRIMWFFQTEMQVTAYAAIVVFVHSDDNEVDYVNISYYDHSGVHGIASRVPIYNGEGLRPDCFFVEWMPYQLGQAAKTEAAEKKLEECNPK